MQIKSKGIVNGYILDKYGKRGKQQKFGMPTLSIPFEIINPPKNTKCFAVIFDDPDSVKVCNKVWIHWLIANLQKQKVEENESLGAYDFLQGKNSWNDNCYGGPCPPDKDHNYRLKVFALSEMLNLRGDFSLELLENEMKNKVLEIAELRGIYKK